jgi:hypothetical protein
MYSIYIYIYIYIYSIIERGREREREREREPVGMQQDLLPERRRKNKKTLYT